MNNQSMNRFLGACEATGPIRLAAERPRVFGPVSVMIDKPFALIGSGVNADLRLDDNQVSHRHLYLQVYNGRVFAIDLGSRTGTHWENEKQPFGWLDSGKSLWVGRHRVYLENEPTEKPSPELPETPLLSREFRPPNLPPVSLEFVKGGIQKKGVLKAARCGVNRVLVLLGRADGCKIRLLDSSVSKYHCSLIRTPRGVWVVDLLSRNGIWVNGAKVPWARLEQGDRLEIGAFVLRLHYDETQNDRQDADPDPSEDPAESDPAIPDMGSEEFERRSSNPADNRARPGESHIQAYLDASAVDETVPKDSHHALVLSTRRSMVPIELSESIAVIIANQFSQMQQQMFDQFHQAMMVMFQTFSTLHKDQMELVRHELDRVHDLTRQLHALRTELAKQPAAEKGSEVQGALYENQPVAGAPSVDPAQAFNPEGWNDAFREAAQKVMATNWGEPTQPARSPIYSGSQSEIANVIAETPLAGLAPSGRAEAELRTMRSQAELGNEDQDQKSPIPESEFRSINPDAGAAANSNQPIPPVAADIHAMLCKKIAAIQSERQTRWQKIMGFLAGKQTSEAVP
jgi:pSer/pThr/pTyr-binding forkhead associated (FHA) protein